MQHFLEINTDELYPIVSGYLEIIEPGKNISNYTAIAENLLLHKEQFFKLREQILACNPDYEKIYSLPGGAKTYFESVASKQALLIKRLALCVEKTVDYMESVHDKMGGIEVSVIGTIFLYCECFESGPDREAELTTISKAIEVLKKVQTLVVENGGLSQVIEQYLTEITPEFEVRYYTNPVTKKAALCASVDAEILSAEDAARPLMNKTEPLMGFVTGKHTDVDAVKKYIYDYLVKNYGLIMNVILTPMSSEEIAESMAGLDKNHVTDSGTAQN